MKGVPVSFTIPEAVILAAYQIEKAGNPISVESLTVVLWRSGDRRFALPGWEEHPDPRRVATALMGKRGLVAQGLLTRKDGLYYLTKVGRDEIICILAAGPDVPKPSASKPAANGKPAIKQAQSGWVLRLLAPEVLTKWRASPDPKVGVPTTFKEALEWWECWPDPTKDDLDHNLVIMADRLAKLVADSPITLSNGRHLSREDAMELQSLNEWLMTRYRTHINLVKNRVKGTA
jgi:hypothetical protein